MNHQNFKDWYANVLEGLYANGNAGFPIMMIAFPLLERYLREKSGSYEEVKLNDEFFLRFKEIFPEVGSKENAVDFWQAYRHGILHQGAVSQKKRKGVRLPSGWLSHDFGVIVVDDDGNFCVHPVKFAKRVIQVIEKDFTTFEAKHSGSHPFPQVSFILPSIYGTAAPDASFKGWPKDTKKGG
jgi:hypothetical protein